MFLIALFATFGLGDTSTKFIAEYIQKDMTCVKSIVKASLKIVLAFSASMCVLLFVFAQQVADYVNEPQLVLAFRFLGVIIVFRALNTVGAGILGGFKDYKQLGINNIIAGSTMFLLSVPLAYFYTLKGALSALLISQVGLSILNLFFVYRHQKEIVGYSSESFNKPLVSFSFPFAMNEFVYTMTNWGANLLFAKYATMRELGIFTACEQWSFIILFVPGLLGNVILSYLSTTAVEEQEQHDRIVRRMLQVNFLCTVIPLLIVFILSPMIVSYYGPSFSEMTPVLCVTICGTVFICMTRVFQSNLMSEGKKWTAFGIRNTYNILYFVCCYLILVWTNGENAAMNISILTVFINFVAVLLYGTIYMVDRKKVAATRV